jgi:hypothetical protein
MAEGWKRKVETESSICKAHHVIAEGFAVESGR